MNIRAFLSLIGACAVLTGCAGKIRYPSYYTLNLTAPMGGATAAKPILGAVAVREFGAPGYLREGPIVYRPTPSQVGFYEYHRWAVDPRKAVTTAMIRKLETHNLFQSVSLSDGRESPMYLLTGTLERLEEVDREKVVTIEVTLSARLTEVQSGEVLWQGVSSKDTKLENSSIGGIVAEMSRAVDEAVAQLASSLQDRLAPASATRRGGN